MIVVTKELVYAAAAGCSAATGAVHDLRSRRIPNTLTAGSLLGGLVLHLLLSGFRGLLWSAAAGLLAGGTLFIFYLAGGMGAGDVKLMAAVGCLAGFAALPGILMVTAVSGALLALLIGLRHRRLSETLSNTVLLIGHHRQRGLIAHTELNAGNADALRMPFAVPIAAGCLVSLCIQIGQGWNC